MSSQSTSQPKPPTGKPPAEYPKTQTAPRVSKYDLVTKDLVQKAFVKAPDRSDEATLHDLSPTSLVQLCTDTLTDSTSSLASTEANFLPRGFRQTCRISLAPKSTSDKRVFVPLTITILQCDTHEKALAALEEYTTMFQTGITDRATRFRKVTTPIGNNALELDDNAIFWQRNTTFVIVEARRNVRPSPGTGTAQQLTIPNFKTLATELDKQMVRRVGRIAEMKSIGIEKADIPPVKVGEVTMCKIAFQTGAHDLRSVTLRTSNVVTLGAEIDANGAFGLIGEGQGTAALIVRVAHAQSLKATETSIPVTIGTTAGSSSAPAA